MKTNENLAMMKRGESGVVVSVSAGRGLTARLETMGIRPGVRLRKVSGSFMRGPVTVRVGNSRMALGFGMAAKILVAVGS